jgi:hypothetical protein
LDVREFEGGVRERELDAATVGGGEFLYAVRQFANQQTDVTGLSLCAAFEPNARTVPGDHCGPRIIGRNDRVDAKAETIGEEFQVCVQVFAGEEELCGVDAWHSLGHDRILEKLSWIGR